MGLYLEVGLSGSTLTMELECPYKRAPERSLAPSTECGYGEKVLSPTRGASHTEQSPTLIAAFLLPEP